MAEPQCHKCSKTASTLSKPLQLCSRCRSVSYCSSECQKDDWASHKPACKRQNYVLKVRLLPDVIDDPPIMRLLSCPATLTFAELHRALQIAFGWASTHAYDFAVQDPDYEEEEDADIRKMIQEIQFGKSALEPTEFLCRISEKEQGGGGFGHIDKMHEGKRKHPRTPEKNSWKTKLFQILDDPKYGGNDIEYMYDFGDNWSHIITLEGRQAPTLNLTCTDGTGHGVAEDVKQSGWAELKEAYRTSSPTQEQRELRNWFENEASNCDPDGLGGGREFRWAEGEVNRRFAEAGL